METKNNAFNEMEKGEKSFQFLTNIFSQVKGYHKVPSISYFLPNEIPIDIDYHIRPINGSRQVPTWIILNKF